MGAFFHLLCELDRVCLDADGSRARRVFSFSFLFFLLPAEVGASTYCFLAHAMLEGGFFLLFCLFIRSFVRLMDGCRISLVVKVACRCGVAGCRLEYRSTYISTYLAR